MESCIIKISPLASPLQKFLSKTGWSFSPLFKFYLFIFFLKFGIPHVSSLLHHFITYIVVKHDTCFKHTRFGLDKPLQSTKLWQKQQKIVKWQKIMTLTHACPKSDQRAKCRPWIKFWLARITRLIKWIEFGSRPVLQSNTPPQIFISPHVALLAKTLDTPGLTLQNCDFSDTKIVEIY